MEVDTLYLPTILLVTFVIVYIKRKGFTPGYLKSFLWYLGITFLIETTAHILIFMGKSNIILYNFGMLFEVLFFTFIFYSVFQNAPLKKVIQVFAVFFICFFAINIIWIQPVPAFSSNAYSLGCIFLSYICLRYLFFMVTKGKRDPSREFFFWMTIGVLVCYLGNLPYLMIIKSDFEKEDGLTRNLSIISKTVNTLLYILIIVGTLCQKKVLKYKQ